MVLQPNWGLSLGHYHFLAILDHTPGRSSLNKRPARRTGRQLHETQQVQETNNHALGEIRNNDPSNQAVYALDSLVAGIG